MLLEVAWVGKWSKHLYQGLDLNNVPWMMTLGGQSFAKAYAALWKADQLAKPRSPHSPFLKMPSLALLTALASRIAQPQSWQTRADHLYWQHSDRVCVWTVARLG